MDMLGKAKWLDEMCEVLQQLKDEGYCPDIVTYGILINGFGTLE
jgi:pentatricopeptide repeat protein